MSWIQLILVSTDDRALRVWQLLEEGGALAVTLSDAQDERLYEPEPGATPLWRETQVTALFETEDGLGVALEHLRAAYPKDELPPHRVERLDDRAWEREWMRRFKPIRFGRRLLIAPSWSRVAERHRVGVVLDPGLAFGTGSHATTQMCLEWLEGADLLGRSVTDYGCGSGILAISAVKLGARHAYAVDIDPQALSACRENIRRNGVADQVLELAPQALPSRPADILLANILAAPLVELASQFADRVRSGGDLVLSGILEHQTDAVVEVYSEWFDMAPVTHRDGWVRLNGRRASLVD